MKRLKLSILLLSCYFFQFAFVTNKCFSQMTGFSSLVKKNLNLEDVKSWPTIGIFPAISKDGAYFMYEILNQPAKSSTLIVKSTKGEWEKKILGIRLGFGKVFFSDDSKQLIYQKEDSLFFLTLGESRTLYDKVIPYVTNISFPKSGNWFIYRSKKNEDEATIYFLNTGKESTLKNIKGYWFSKEESSILLKDEIESGDRLVKSLKFLDVTAGAMTTIWSDTLDCDDITFSNDGLQLAFSVDEPETKNNNKIENTELKKSIWYFRRGMKTAIKKVNPSELKKDFIVVGRPKFTDNSNWLVFDCEKKKFVQQPDVNAVDVKIWSYKDKIILPEQIRQNENRRSYKAAINLITNQLVPIENDSDFLSYGPIGDFVILKGEIFSDALWWKIDPPHSTILFSLKDGSRKILKNNSTSLINFSSSPNGDWLIYYDKSTLNFFSYNLNTGKILNLTKSIPAIFRTQFDGGKDGITLPVYGVVTWVKEDNSLILYDNYDIWKIDPSGVRKAINITNSYGKKNKIKLKLVYSNEVQFGTRRSIISSSDTLLITGFSVESKYNGLFKKVLNESGDPQKLSMGPYTYYRTESQKPHFWSLSDGMQPIKADSANIWVVSRETASDSKNYFLTKDFKEFRPLTNLYPEKEYNWLTAELVSWKQLDGTMSQGILYKPENFDPRKKYPLLITYYEKMSHRLYEFPTPAFCDGDINIPWFVTHGYFVFTPDIHYSIASASGKTTGDCAVNSVVSAAQFLAKLPYVDKAKMGIEGHSFGGAQTNFIITHTNLFAAACEFAGGSDAVSGYLTLVPFGAPFENYSKQHISESGQGRIGASLWERPDLYLKQSAVLQADKITTPMLIAHNEKDNNISFRQGIELYMALRRLGKKVWMLQYNDRHSLYEEKYAIDFTIRLTQFYDHYLKGQLPPKWMTEGIPIGLIGIYNGYEVAN